MDQNPWAVESIQAFYILKCPECDFHIREENSFENHATENHPLSSVLFDKKSVKKDFCFLKCPECDFYTREENSFENHATENHPLSFILFDKQSVKKDFDAIKIKEEPFSHFDTQISHTDKNSLTNNKFSPSCFINENTSMLVVQDLKKEQADVDENELRAYENDFNNSSEMENYSTEDFDAIDIKEEPLSQYDTEIYHENEKSSTLNQFPEFKKEPTDGTYMDENDFQDKENGINDSEMENCSTDIANIGVNLEGDPQSSDMLAVYEGKKQCKSGQKVRAFKCNFCDYETSKNCILKKHIESVHEGNKPFKCKLCEYESALKGNLKTHIRSVHERIKPFKCNDCDYQAAQKVTLKNHIKSVHITNIGVNFKENPQISNEMLVHEEKKQYKCNICKSKRCFSTEQDLNQHMNQHSKKKLLIVTKDKSTLSSRFVFQTGVKTIHEDNHPFQCSICNKGFPRVSDIKRHVQVIHDEKFDPDQHVEIVHEGKKPLVPISNKSFPHKNGTKSNKNNKENNSADDAIIENHIEKGDPLKSDEMLVHEEKKPYECITCGETFVNCGELKTHMLAIHKKTKVVPRYVYDICKYPKKFYQQLKVFFITYLIDARN